MPRQSELTGLGIFGAFDGLMTALGVVLGASGAPHRVILEVALCVSITGALSMGAGAVLEDDHHGWREGLVMGAATLAGTFLPSVPILLLSRPVAFVVTGALAVGLAGAIAVVRAGGKLRRRDLMASYGLLLGVAIPTICIALAFGASSS